MIGVAAGMTGALQPWGLWPRQMAELAVDDLNTNCGGLLGRPVKIVWSDDKSDFAANGAAAALDVIDQGAVAVLSSCDYDWSSPANSTAQDHEIPGISFCAGAPQFGPNGLGPYTFSNGIATPNEASAPAEWAYNDQGWRNVYLLNDPLIDYDTTYCKAFGKRWEQLGGTVVGQDEFQQADPQVGPQITRFKGLSPQPDFIVLCSIPPGGATAIRQFRAAGIDTPFFLNVGMGGDFWYDSVPNFSNAYQDAYVSWNGDDPIPLVNDLAQRWKEKYGTTLSSTHAYMGYEAIILLAAAITKAGTTDGPALQQALTGIDFQGLIGDHKLNPDYNQSFTLPVTIIKIDGGKASFLTRVQPQVDATSLLPLD